MASGALPPGFPPIEIEGEHYWDGGLVSNTPLQWVLECPERRDTLAFQVDLWNARGAGPAHLAEVMTRQKEIQYSSRTRANSDRFRQEQKLRNALADLMAKLPDELRDDAPNGSSFSPEAGRKVYNIIQLIYRSKDHEGGSKDYEFSRRSMEDHWAAGYDDTIRTLAPSRSAGAADRRRRRLHLRSRRARPRRSEAGKPMNATEVRERAFAMPLTQPAYPPGPYRFYDREFLIITYRTDREKLRELVPEPLEIVSDLVKFEFIRMPNSTGFGDYTEAGQVIPVRFRAQDRATTRFACSSTTIRRSPRGRELWGFPKKLAGPDAAHGNRHAGRHARLWAGPRGHRHDGLQAQGSRRRRDAAKSWPRPTSCSRSSRTSTAARGFASWSSIISKTFK